VLSALHRDQKSLKYIIDVTIGYANGRPFELLTNVVAGDGEPRQTMIHYRKYPAATVPRSETMLTCWLYERFAEKDRLLDHFYRTGNFATECPNGSITSANVKCCSHSVRFSAAVCLLMHAFYILSTFMHLYVAIRICCFFWSLFV